MGKRFEEVIMGMALKEDCPSRTALPHKLQYYSVRRAVLSPSFASSRATRFFCLGSNEPPAISRAEGSTLSPGPQPIPRRFEDSHRPGLGG